MSQKPIDDFFSRWKDNFPEETKECPSDYKLVDFAQKNPAEWSSHVKQCRHCREVINLLTTKKTPTKLYEFLSRANEDAISYIPAKRTWLIPSFLRTFWSLGQPKWVSAALVGTLALFLVTWKINSSRSSLNDNELSAVVTLDEDKYAHTVNWLYASVDTVNNPTLSSKEFQVRAAQLNKDVPEINKKLVDLGHKQLTPEQRAELAKLVTAYNTGVTLSKQRVVNTNATPRLATTGDSQVVATIYEEAYGTLNKKKSGDETGSNQEVKNAQAIQVAAQEIEVVAIDAGEVKVLDLEPNRDPKEKQALETSLNTLLNTRKMSVRFVHGPSPTALAPSTRALAPSN